MSLDLRRIAARHALLDPLMGAHHLIVMLFDVAKDGLDLLHRERQNIRDLRGTPARLQVVQHVEDRDPQPIDTVVDDDD